MLFADDISFWIKDKPLLQDISLELEQGRIYSILGPNGAGKSTLLKCLAGFLKVTSGQMFFQGQPFENLSLEELALKRAVLTQQVALDFPFTVREVASMGRANLSTSKSQLLDKSIIDEALDLTKVHHLQKRNFSTLSGGEQQRVHLARVIAQVWEQENALLLLDEPTSALDLKHQYMLFDICRDLCEDKGFSVVTVLHDFRLARTVSDEALFIDKGRIFEHGKSKEVINTETLCDLYQLKPHQAQI